MNRFAALDDSDNDEPKTSNAPTKDKKKKVTVAPAPAAPVADSTKPAPKKDGEARKKANGDKPKSPRPRSAPAAASVSAPAEANDGNDAALPTKGEGRAHNKKSHRNGKIRDATDPTVKGDNLKSGHYHTKSKNKGGESGADIVKEAQAAEDDAVEEVATETVAENPVVEEPAEPEGPATITLNEYLRQREEARAASALLGASKVARAVDEDFKGLKIKGDDETPAVFTGAGKSTKGKEKSSTQRSTAKTVLTDLTFKGDESSAAVEESPRDRRSPGGRGTPRGSPRGSPRGAKIDIGDKNAFPSL